MQIKNQFKKQLGKQIQRERKQKGFTQEYLAEQIGIDPKSLSYIENGGSFPSAETLSAIIKALNIEPYELFVFDNEIPYAEMKKEIIKSLDNDKTVLMLYKKLKGLG